MIRNCVKYVNPANDYYAFWRRDPTIAGAIAQGCGPLITGSLRHYAINIRCIKYAGHKSLM